jgi:hypothetical protein
MLIIVPQDCENLDFEIMLRKVIEKHAQVLLVAITNKFQNDPSLEFSEPGVVIAEKDGELPGLMPSVVHIYQYSLKLSISISARTKSSQSTSIQELGD